MRILVAGATGAIGRQLLPRLAARGHEVFGMTRTTRKRELIQALDATAIVADALDAVAVGEAVSRSEPDVIVHQLTALSGALDLRKFERTFLLTNRLRREGTDHLLSAGQAAGVQKFVAQSFAGAYPRTGGAVKTEEDPLDPEPATPFRANVAAIRHLEEAVLGATWTEGIVLRYGAFYGPGTSLAVEPPGEQVQALRARKFPVVGNGAGVWSLIHVADAADATVAAIERGHRGIYNIVDDEPTVARELLPGIARAIGARPPLRVPRWLARLLAGEAVTVLMTQLRGASNAKAKRELDWQPSYPSWREGLAAGARESRAPTLTKW